MTDTTVKISDAAIRRQMLKEFWFYFSQNRGAVAGLVVFLLLVLTAIFFFDGERISALAEDTGDHTLLAETVKALLGLNLVDQLQRDLDVFLTRRSPASGRNQADYGIAHAAVWPRPARTGRAAARLHSCDG